MTHSWRPLSPTRFADAIFSFNEPRIHDKYKSKYKAHIHFKFIIHTKFMCFELSSYKSFVVTMSLVSVILFAILHLNFVKSDISKEQIANVTPSMQNFKEYMTRVIKEQSTKIQVLLNKIQLNAQTVLRKIRDMNQDPKNGNVKASDRIEKIVTADYQNKSPISENNENIVKKTTNSRSFGSHYGNTGFGVSASANYAPTYHHHSIGFDPINIVVSMSLLSFLLQALQGLLSRARLPTLVVEGRGQLNEDWFKNLEKRNDYKEKQILKRKYRKKYY